jgi:hypothetical protein
LSKKHSKFSKEWASQTTLGRRYGLSSIAVGKLFVEAGWKDPVSKRPTTEALEEGIARATPLADGTEHFMWSREKTASAFCGQQVLSKEERYANDVRGVIRQAERLIDGGTTKLGFLLLDSAYDEVPAPLRGTVKHLVEGTTE